MSKKHKLKNLAVYNMPIEGTDIILQPGQIGEAVITPRLDYFIKNKIFEDLGEVYVPEKVIKENKVSTKAKRFYKKELNKHNKKRFKKTKTEE